MPKDPRSYTTIDVAKRLGVSLQTVQRWVDAGHLKAWKTLGGHRRIEASGAELLFREQEERLGGPEVTDIDSGLCVVVVDDNPMDLAVLVELVQEALPSARVEAVTSGYRALMEIGKTAPQIVITDLHMPNIDGFEMIRTLLADPALRPRTLIAVSAMSTQELSAEGGLPSEVQFFDKPVERERLIAALRNSRGTTALR